MISGVELPSPNTVCVARFHNSHSWQPLAALFSALIVRRRGRFTGSIREVQQGQSSCVLLAPEVISMPQKSHERDEAQRESIPQRQDDELEVAEDDEEFEDDDLDTDDEVGEDEDVDEE